LFSLHRCLDPIQNFLQRIDRLVPPVERYGASRSVRRFNHDERHARGCRPNSSLNAYICSVFSRAGLNGKTARKIDSKAFFDRFFRVIYLILLNLPRSDPVSSNGRANSGQIQSGFSQSRSHFMI